MRLSTASGDESCLLLGIHPTTISDSFQKAAAKSADILESMSTAVQLTDRESLLQSATTALSSKVSPNLLCIFRQARQLPRRHDSNWTIAGQYTL